VIVIRVRCLTCQLSRRTRTVGDEEHRSGSRDTRDRLRQHIFFAEYSWLNLIRSLETVFIILSGFACYISMNWGWYWRGLVAAVVLASGFLWFHSTDAANPLSGSSSWTPQRKLAAR
jgi:hypothetical protein